jgi:hypothetical protein
LRSATTFWAQFYTTQTRKKNNLIGRHTISNNVVEVLVGKCGKEKQSHKLFLFLWAGAFTPAHRNYPQTSIDSGSKLYVGASWWDCETYSSSSNQFEKIKFYQISNVYWGIKTSGRIDPNYWIAWKKLGVVRVDREWQIDKWIEFGLKCAAV